MTISATSASNDERAVDPQFKHDVINCFQSEKRAIPARWLYDYAGSELFDAITQLPEYYPTRTETALLKDCLDEAAGIIGPKRNIVEFGAGSVTKTPLLIEATNPAHFIPIDISGDFLRSSVETLQQLFPQLPIMPIEADFMKTVVLPEALNASNNLGFFPGSTIGNMIPMAATDLLRSMRATLGDDAMLMIGFDRIKDKDVLVAAYDDSAGVTADFNLNLLKRIKRELDSDIDVEQFRHLALWNESENRIEMHLEALSDMQFSIAGEVFSMHEGETIHTENSHKYGISDAQTLLRGAGWTPVEAWSDDNDYFSIILAQAKPTPYAP